jgi:CHAT domain-containing protein
MRAGAILFVVLVGGAPRVQAAPPPEPTPAQKTELDRLDKELRDQQMKSAYFAAAKVARKLYALQRDATGDGSREAERRKAVLANLLSAAGDYAEAMTLFQELLRATEKEKGPESRETLFALMTMTGVYWAQGRTDELEPIIQRIVALTKKLNGEQSQEYAHQLATQGALFYTRNEYSSALRLYEQSLRIQEALAAARKDDTVLLSPLQMLAVIYWQTNQQPKAIALNDRSIAIASKSPNVQTQAGIRLGIAGGYQAGGRPDLAAPLVKRAIELYETEIARLETTKPDDPMLPVYLGSLGTIYQQNGDVAAADKVLSRAVAIGGKGKAFSGWETLLAMVKRAEGKPKEALALLERQKAAMEKITPLAAISSGWQIAEALREMGDTRRAEKVLEEHRAAIAKYYGTRHPMYGQSLMSASKVYAAAGKIPQAERALTDSLELAEKDLSLVLRTGTESDHAVYFARNNYQLDTAISFELNSAPNSAAAARLGLTTLLRRKGRVLDAAAGALATIRSKLAPEDKKLLDALASARAQLAKLTVAGPTATGQGDYAKEIAALEDRIQKLEVEVSKKSAAYRVVNQPIDLAAVQKMIPADARLIEMVNYQPLDWKAPYSLKPTYPPRRYAAYVVGNKGDPTLIELGDAAAIDKAVQKFRKAVSDPDNDGAVDLGRALYDLTLAKIVPRLGGATNLLIAPDGALNLVPFAALVDEKRQFLIKTYTFTYPTSGRDLLRLKVSTRAQGGGMVFADPSFDSTAPAPAPSPSAPAPDGGTRGRRSAELRAMNWQPLPGTSQEADAVGKAMAGLTILRGKDATEGAVKEVHGPRVLHLATHGFFLPDEPAPEGDAGARAGGAAPAAGAGSVGSVGSVGGVGSVGLQAGASGPARENPLLRSGLALAGANKLRSGDDDGILTAMEASGLDLWGTKLVVLSACETGVGTVTNGEGVYGLRRALVIAGAESLVTTLWQVDDLATRDLMAGYYRKLAAGKGRSSALHDIQLEIAAQPKYAHPFYWASFLAAGADAPINED